ncbi:MAG: hypothetical protein KDA41_04550, partial [Planctomycetales bacterium]|nr:hypothetical protein [Planctomycetales bacterium]
TLALAGLVLVGALLLSLTWLAFRMVRRNIQISRQVAERQGPTRVDDDRWSRKPLTKNPE